MRPRQQIGKRITPARKDHWNLRHRQLATQFYALRMCGDWCVRGHKSGREQWIVREVAIDQKPPARRYEQSFAPTWERYVWIGKILQIIEQRESRRKGVAIEFFDVERLL